MEFKGLPFKWSYSKTARHITRECLVIGNDVDEDMIAETAGMSVFLITDNNINRSNKGYLFVISPQL